MAGGSTPPGRTLTDLDLDSIPRVILVFNGPLKMSPGKMAAQAFQVCQRLLSATPNSEDDVEDWLRKRGSLRDWEVHTTTIARVAKTTAMFERVCAEVPGIVMVDEGYTEVDPDTPTVFASWPAPRTEEHKLLGNAKVQLLRDAVAPFAAWTDEQIGGVASALDAASSEGAFGDETDVGIARELRAEAASRHLNLPAPYGGEEIAPDRWLAGMLAL